MSLKEALAFKLRGLVRLANRVDIFNIWLLDEGRKIVARAWLKLALVVISPSRTSVELSDVTFDGGAFMLRLLCDKGGDTWPKALALSSISSLSPQGNLYLSWLCRGRGSCSDGTVGVIFVVNSKGNEQRH